MDHDGVADVVPEADDGWASQIGPKNINITNIAIVGANRTKSDVFRYFLDDIVKASTFDDLIGRLQKGGARLQVLGIFDGIDFHVDRDEDGGSYGGTNTAVVVRVIEKKLTETKIENETTPDGTTWSVSSAIKNYFGTGESFNAQIQMGKRPSSFQIGYTKPLLYGSKRVPKTFDAHLFKSAHDYTTYGSYTENVRGIMLRTFIDRHQFSYEGSWRTTDITGPLGSPLVAQAGDSFKSSVRYSTARDTRDHHLLPTRGYCVTATSELAGLGGDTFFAKQDATLQYNIPLTRGISINYLLKGGIMLPLSVPPPSSAAPLPPLPVMLVLSL
eukprot:TRINITY_DN5375_c0_g1_i2.p1 TRINITY_DN5375_c0_g1~~TRINITY_DN5375_c0_g1_i2.p1  ORF type:complete len:329 (-),score=50.24 TRINITY_DN5375_c0_g1_i2:93-1079(-)